MLCLHPRDSQRRGALALDTRKLAVDWRPQLACRTTVWLRRREASRRCSALSYGLGRPQPARYGARARQARVLRLLPRDSQCSGAPARATRRSRLCINGRSWHVAPRSCSEREKPPAGVLHLHGAWADHNQRGTARARGKLACCASSQETVNAVARARMPRESRLCVGGRSWHVAPRSRNEERCLPPVYCLSNMRNTITTSAARHARTASSRAVPPRERQAPQWRARVCHAKGGCGLEVAAGTSHHGLAPKARSLPPVQCPFTVRV